MAKPFQVQYRPFGLGGMNDSVADEFIADGEMSAARNWMPDPTGSGALIKREGIDDATAAQAGTVMVTSIYTGRNRTYYTELQGAAGPWTLNIRNTGTTILDNSATVASLFTLPDWATFATYDIMVDGENALKSSDGTTFSAVTGMPAGVKYVASANNFLYFAGHAQGTLGWFNAGTITYNATNALLLSQDEADDIRGIVPWRNALFVLCQKSFRLVSGSSNLEHGVAYYSQEVGGGNHSAIVITPAGLMFWSLYGPAIIRPDFTVDYCARRKIPKFLSTLGLTAFEYSHGVHDPMQQKAMFYAPTAIGGGGPSGFVRLDYYYTKDAWFIHDGDGADMNCSALITPESNPRIWGGDADNCWAYDSTYKTDNGTAISAYAEGKREAYGGPTVYKMSRKSTLTVSGDSPSEITYGVYIDNDTTLDTTWDFDIDSGVQDVTIGTNRAHTKIKHRIADSSVYRNKILGLTHDGNYSRQF